MTKTITQLRWYCRRGMLELDLLLAPFLENQYADLNEEEKLLFEQLLASEDQDLYDWLVKKEIPENQNLIVIINKITL